MAISVITITDEREELVDFSDPYFFGKVDVLIRKDNISEFAGIHTKEELIAKKRLGTQMGTLMVAFLKSISEDNEIFTQRTWDELINSLLNGDVDAVVINRTGARSYMKQHENLATLPHIELYSTDYGVAVKKGNTSLFRHINKTLEKLKKSGQYDELVEEYLN